MILHCSESGFLFQNTGNRRASTPTPELKGIEEETEESDQGKSETGATAKNEPSEKEEVVTCKYVQGNFIDLLHLVLIVIGLKCRTSFFLLIKSSIGFKGKISEVFNAIFDIQLKSLFTPFD